MSANPESYRTLIIELLTPALKRASICPAEVDDDFNVIDRGVVDSLGFLELLTTLEQRAGVELQLFDADPDVLTTVGGLSAVIHRAQ